jgi:hypothetical protein
MAYLLSCAVQTGRMALWRTLSRLLVPVVGAVLDVMKGRFACVVLLASANICQFIS